MGEEAAPFPLGAQRIGPGSLTAHCRNSALRRAAWGLRPASEADTGAEKRKPPIEQTGPRSGAISPLHFKQPRKTALVSRRDI